MKKVSQVLLVLCLLIAVCGCFGGRAKALVGKYKGEATLPDSAKNDPQAAMAQAFLSALSLELKDDSTFIMSIMVPIEGNWSIEGDRLKLMPTKLMGMSMDDYKKQASTMGGAAASEKAGEPMEFDISADNKTLTAVPKAGAKSQGAGLTFKKT